MKNENAESIRTDVRNGLLLTGLESHPIDKEQYPLLSGINSPADLRKLDLSVLESLCTEIRRFLTDSLSVNPGHYASSMGAVELTVAIHYVFDTPDDRIVWDVGHQAYVHKLLTGRAPYFYTNRKLGGLSGFPNPAESEYDTFTAGHASNSISAALGMSVASALKNEEQRNVVAVIGDASISGGLAFEGINNAANSESNLLIILNDNDMSIDRNVGSLNSYLAHINTSKAYNSLRYKAYKTLNKMHLVNERNRGSILRFNNSLKALLSHEQNIFEGLNIRYFGPFDGHDLGRIIRVLTDIKNMRGPRLLHLRTVKGRGYEPAEKDPANWHAPGRFNVTTGVREAESKATAAKQKWQDVFGEELTRLAADNENIVAITAAMPSGTSVSKMQEKFSDRTFDVGISEGHAVTFAGGLAKEGMLPFVAIYSSFLQRAYDHIIHDVAIQGLPVTFCIDRAGIVGEDGVTHHGVYDISFLRNIPGMVVAAPRHDEQLRQLLRLAQSKDRKGPMAIRYPRGTALKALAVDTTAPVKIGCGQKLRDGADVNVLTIGPIADEVAKAIKFVAGQGVEAAHYDMIFISPLDEEIMHEVGRSGKPVVTVEDGTVAGGFGSAVTEWLVDHGYMLPVKRIGIPVDFIGHGTPAELYKICGMDSVSIAEAILEQVKKHV